MSKIEPRYLSLGKNSVANRRRLFVRVPSLSGLSNRPWPRIILKIHKGITLAIIASVLGWWGIIKVLSYTLGRL
jgi:hypothetical protein